MYIYKDKILDKLEVGIYAILFYFQF